MDLFTIMTILGAVVTVGGPLAGWILKLQGTLIKHEARIEALELGSGENINFLKELREEFKAMFAGFDRRMDEFEKDLTNMARELAVLADRENRRDRG